MLLACRHITLKYAGSEKYVLKNFGFEIDGPGFHALFGPSGVGKTSLARILIGSISDYDGEIVKRRIQSILYSYNMERLPGWSNVGTHLDRITPSAKRDLKDEMVNAFGLASFCSQRFSQLSLGQKNRINLIRYLVQDFQVLIMDESLANVDEITREKILLTIKDLFPDRCFFYISHNVLEVSKFCEHIVVIRDANKQPQAHLIKGQNFSNGHPLDKNAYEKTMLEIMNAS
ncbi:MAG: ATP-binding cassette domain-containing protein [Desulfobacteraceae bacterium]|nr:ATP-binding cassette domain-containing protein [Desulfobacteraceae bacterium]